MKVVFYKDIFTEENLSKMGLNERQIRAVLYVKGEGKIALSEYKKLLESKIDDRTLRRDLEDLVNRKILKPIGEKKVDTMSYQNKGHLSDISDNYQTFVGHLSVEKAILLQPQQWTCKHCGKNIVYKVMNRK